MTLDDAIATYPKIKKLFESVQYDKIDECTIKKLSRREPIVSKGQKIELCYIVLSGRMSVINSFQNGKSYSYVRVGTGALLGEMELCGGEDHFISTVECLNTCYVIQFHRSVLNYWLEHYHQYALYASYRLGNMLCISGRNNGRVMMHSSTELFGLIMIDEYDHREKGIEILKIPHTKEKLASYIGVNVRTVHRLVSSLEKKNCLTRDDRSLLITKENYANLIILTNHPDGGEVQFN